MTNPPTIGYHNGILVVVGLVALLPLLLVVDASLFINVVFTEVVVVRVVLLLLLCARVDGRNE